MSCIIILMTCEREDTNMHLEHMQTLLGKEDTASSSKRRSGPRDSIVSADQSEGSLQKAKKDSNSCFLCVSECPQGASPTQKSAWRAESVLRGGVEEYAGRRPCPAGWRWGHQAPWGSIEKGEAHIRAVQAWTRCRLSVLINPSPVNTQLVLQASVACVAQCDRCLCWTVHTEATGAHLKSCFHPGHSEGLRSWRGCLKYHKDSLSQCSMNVLVKCVNAWYSVCWVSLWFSLDLCVFLCAHLPGRAELSGRARGETGSAEVKSSGWPLPSCRWRRHTQNQAGSPPVKACDRVNDTQMERWCIDMLWHDSCSTGLNEIRVLSRQVKNQVGRNIIQLLLCDGFEIIRSLFFQSCQKFSGCTSCLY